MAVVSIERQSKIHRIQPANILKTPVIFRISQKIAKHLSDDYIYHLQIENLPAALVILFNFVYSTANGAEINFYPMYTLGIW